jgi:hypothetical protein
VHIIGRTLLPALMAISLFGLAFGVYDLNRQIRNQHGIDAHTRQVTGTVSGAGEGFGPYATLPGSAAVVFGGLWGLYLWRRRVAQRQDAHPLG